MSVNLNSLNSRTYKELQEIAKICAVPANIKVYSVYNAKGLDFVDVILGWREELTCVYEKKCQVIIEELWGSRTRINSDLISLESCLFLGICTVSYTHLTLPTIYSV